jgi:hypothetical protein
MTGHTGGIHTGLKHLDKFRDRQNLTQPTSTQRRAFDLINTTIPLTIAA